jgi:uncharacterized membrane protein YedE/YeeE
MNPTVRKLLYVVYGLVFGLTLSRSGAADFNYIQKMFLFEDFQLYGILASAVITAGVGLWLVKRYGRTITGEPVQIKGKTVHVGNLVGGALFGAGWAVTGMCPGPIMVNIGEGKIYALAAFAGVLVGTWIFGYFYFPLQKRLGLPSVFPAAADGAGKGKQSAAFSGGGGC